MGEFEEAAVQATQCCGSECSRSSPRRKCSTICCRSAAIASFWFAPFTFENIFELNDVTQLCRNFHTFLCEPLRFAALQTPVALLLFGERGMGKRQIARTIADETKCEMFRYIALADNLCQHTTTRQKMSLSAAFESTSFALPSVLLIVDVEKLSPIRLSAAIDDAKAKKGFLFIGTSTDRKRAVEVFANID
ncbi:hypothetical protein niasHS_016190 [Heterodera schachtii]|uniref:ATPase AAA-type core domain-containing protein n=1 Tax=Heterodera schachtii TaxID=97005 RepID=A0ABD2HWH6_HETSC